MASGKALMTLAQRDLDRQIEFSKFKYIAEKKLKNLKRQELMMKLIDRCNVPEELDKQRRWDAMSIEDKFQVFDLLVGLSWESFIWRVL